MHGPRSFLGELGLLEGQTAFVSAVVNRPGEVLAVGSAALRDLLSREPALGDVILRAYLLRRTMLVGAGTGFRIIGSAFSPDTRRLLEFAARNRLPHRWADLEKDTEAEALLMRLGIAPEETPIVVWHDYRVLRNPSNAELARVIGLRPRPPRRPSATWWWSARDPVAWPPRCTAPPRDSPPSSWTRWRPAARPAPPPGSRTTSVSPPGSPAWSSPNAPSYRPTGSAPGSTSPPRPPASNSATGHNVVRLADGGTVTATNVVVATGARYRRLTAPRRRAVRRTRGPLRRHPLGGADLPP